MKPFQPGKDNTSSISQYKKIQNLHDIFSLIRIRYNIGMLPSPSCSIKINTTVLKTGGWYCGGIPLVVGGRGVNNAVWPKKVPFSCVFSISWQGLFPDSNTCFHGLNPPFVCGASQVVSAVAMYTCCCVSCHLLLATALLRVNFFFFFLLVNISCPPYLPLNHASHQRNL